MRDSVRLNSFESFLVTLSSETWEMYSWASSGSSVLCDWLFLLFLGASLETAANFLLILKVAMILREKFCQLWRLKWFFYSITKANISSYYDGNVSTRANIDFTKWVWYQRLQNYIIIIVLSFLLFILFPWRETIVYTPIQGTNREKYFNYLIYRGKMPTLAGNKHLSIHFFLHGPRLFHLSKETVRVQSVRNGHQSGYSSVNTINNNINKRSNRYSIRRI